MKSRKNIILITVGVCLLSLLAVGSAIAGKPGATHFEVIDVACDTFEGNGDLNFAGVLLSDDPRLAGRSEIEISFEGKKGMVIGAVFFPDAFPGSTWVAPGHSTDTPAVAVHKGEGTGVFAGQRIQFTARTIDELPVSPCPGGAPPIGLPVESKGVILDLPNQ